MSSPPAQAARVYRAFLNPLVADIGTHADVVQLWAKRARMSAKTAGQTLWRMTADDQPYPSPANIERVSFGLQARYKWAWSPVLFYASGWLECLVKVVWGVNLSKMSATRLVELLGLIPDVVDGDVAKRRRWELTGSEQEAFPTLADVDGRMLGRSVLPDDLAVAMALSNHFELSYDLLRDRVLGLLISWASEIAKSETKFGARSA